jgi:hypothetical protein
LTVTGGNLTTDSSVVRNNQANTYTAGSKQTFTLSATSAGLNLVSGSDPSSLSQGDVWINGSDLKWRGASATQAAATLVASGTAGVGPSKAGTATTAARSDHDHRSVHALTWFFPGTPATGVQNLTLTFPDGSIANLAILDMRVTVGTVSASSSTFNIQRCTVSNAACSATESNWVDIYSTVLTLPASNYTAAKGSAPNQYVGSLVAGDRFRANLVTIGASLANVTVTMTVKYETTN